MEKLNSMVNVSIAISMVTKLMNARKNQNLKAIVTNAKSMVIRHSNANEEIRILKAQNERIRNDLNTENKINENLQSDLRIERQINESLENDLISEKQVNQRMMKS